ncbi:hypothetical protein [Alkalihalobacillus pseudalcaliphilus]|uniref:hypothetical protein n=1 Tax=Alkalihalobacillus pseudalcaliphilus TaxID=79884 RepID=UPI00064E0369|nr:hypothetical protein [Alkalihalobacillus pseudalcaliphilus]KMK77685.1 hypothetical protein AB990_04300 [Alkalihalobacillus pseudalcaliphilus]
MQDHYTAREPKLLWILLFVITLSYAYLLESSLSYVAYGLLFVFAAAMMIHYELFFSENEIRLEVKILSFKLFEKKATAQEIELIQFVDLIRRHVIFIKKKDGKRIRLHRFVPEHFSGRVRMFAKQHEIKKEEMTARK